MHREESERIEQCSACGNPVDPGADRSYAFGVSGVLCWDCALARGGRYDPETERWGSAPDLSGLPDEAYGAAPHEVRRAPRS